MFMILDISTNMLAAWGNDATWSHLRVSSWNGVKKDRDLTSRSGLYVCAVVMTQTSVVSPWTSLFSLYFQNVVSGKEHGLNGHDVCKSHQAWDPVHEQSHLNTVINKYIDTNTFNNKIKVRPFLSHFYPVDFLQFWILFQIFFFSPINDNNGHQKNNEKQKWFKTTGW